MTSASLPIRTPQGYGLFKELKKLRFVPVIFYTAHPSWVQGMDTAFVRVVEKTETVLKVCEEVKAIIATGLPSLHRRIEDLQRSYMWGFVSDNWKKFEKGHAQGDLAYLLARRLALLLQTESRDLAKGLGGRDSSPSNPADVHPMEVYVPPPHDEHSAKDGKVGRGSAR